MSAHDCPLPTPRRKWRHQLYICDCGRAWRARHHMNWAESGYEWERWKP